MTKRGRKKGANGEKSRELLLRIAAEEFAGKGYYETKISTIVKRANVTQPTFYLYFHSKEAIFQELIDQFHSKLLELIRQSRLAPGLELSSVKEEIKGKLTAIFLFFKENRDITQIGFFIAAESEKIKTQLAEKIEENLNKEKADGYFQPDIDMCTVAEMLLGIIERLTVTRLFKGLTEPEDLADEIVHLLLFGMLADKSKGL